MENVIDREAKHPDEIADMLAGSVGCKGTCTYTVVGSTTVVTGQCTGLSSCPSCPKSFTPSTFSLIRKLPTLIVNPDSFSLNCNMISADVPVLKLFDEYVLLYDLFVILKRGSVLYRNLAILLGVVSLLLLGGLIYTLVLR